MPHPRPIRAEVEWSDGEVPKGEPITKPGRHHGAEFVAKAKEENRERRARYRRDYGGRERDLRKIPPPEHQLSGRTYKSSSKIRFPSQLFRKNYDLIRWDR